LTVVSGGLKKAISSNPEKISLCMEGLNELIAEYPTTGNPVKHLAWVIPKITEAEDMINSINQEDKDRVLILMCDNIMRDLSDKINNTTIQNRLAPLREQIHSLVDVVESGMDSATASGEARQYTEKMYSLTGFKPNGKLRTIGQPGMGSVSRRSARW
jgi:hypothetical protein